MCLASAARSVSAASSPGALPELPCSPGTGRTAFGLEGEVYGDQAWRQALPNGWVFALLPGPFGWHIRLFEHDGPDAVDLSAITPPHHGPPNPRDIEGWHFRNAANTGPNKGDVNAAQTLRLFAFSASLVGTGGFKPNTSPDLPRLDTPPADAGRGWLRMIDYGLADLAPGERARMNYLDFEACLTWPHNTVVNPPPAAHPDRADMVTTEALETLGACGLDLHRYELRPVLAPASQVLDIDGDGAWDEVFQIGAKDGDVRALALCRAGSWLHLAGPEEATALSGVLPQLESWHTVARDHGPFGYVDEPRWPRPEGDVLVLERFEKSMDLLYWKQGALRTQRVYRYIEREPGL